MIDTLEDIIRRIVREEVARVLTLPPPLNYDPDRCAYCGGYHGTGVMCPKLRPTTVSAT